MKNEYGLEVDYFVKRLARIIRDAKSYTPDEMARELARCARAADSKVLTEDEFSSSRNAVLGEAQTVLENCERLHDTRIRFHEALGAIEVLKNRVA